MIRLLRASEQVKKVIKSVLQLRSDLASNEPAKLAKLSSFSKNVKFSRFDVAIILTNSS